MKKISVHVPRVGGEVQSKVWMGVLGVVKVKLKSGIPSLTEPTRSLCFFFWEMPEDTVRYLKLQNTGNSNYTDSKREVSTQIKT